MTQERSRRRAFAEADSRLVASWNERFWGRYLMSQRPDFSFCKKVTMTPFLRNCYNDFMRFETASLAAKRYVDVGFY